jgi:hypothetical protein
VSGTTPTKIALAAEAKKRQGRRTDLKPNIHQNSDESPVARQATAKAGKLVGVSHDTVTRVVAVHTTESLPASCEFTRRSRAVIENARVSSRWQSSDTTAKPLTVLLARGKLLASAALRPRLRKK